MLLAPAALVVPSATEAVYGLAEVVVAFLVILGLIVLALGLIREIGR